MENKAGLAEPSTNEFEIIEFSVGNVCYGINVAEVREIINMVALTELPNSHPYVDGIFTLRGKLMPLVNLAKCLNSESGPGEPKIVVTEMKDSFMGFKVDDVSRIHRVSWEQVEPAPEISNSNRIVGVLKMEDRLVVVLDFEKILAEVIAAVQ